MDASLVIITFTFPSSCQKSYLVSLSSNHHIRLVQDKYSNFLDVEETELEGPVQDFSRRANDDVVIDLAPARNLLSFDRVPRDGAKGFFEKTEFPNICFLALNVIIFFEASKPIFRIIWL